jgi:predicted ATPase
MCKITHLAERNEWKVQDNHLDAFMDDTSSLPTTNIINDRLKFFLVFFLKKGSTKNLQRSRITRTNSLKDQTQAITSDWPIKKKS